MSKALQEKIDELFEATKDFKSLEEIKPYCDRFNEWISEQSYTEKSLGTLLSRYGLYKKFRDLPLEQGKNAELIPKYDGEGRVKGHEFKHYVPLYCGGDKGDNSPVLAFRHGEAQDNNKALRAAYAVLATERDCQGSFGAKILHASRLLGHFVKEIKNDRDLANLGTSAGYSDYFTAKPVQFPTAPEKEKTTSIRVNESDLEPLRKLQDFWKLPNQQSVVSKLIERQAQTVELGKQLQEFQAKNNQLSKQNQEFKARINQLEKEKREMSQVTPEPQTEPTTPEQATSNMEALESRIERLIEEKLSKALSNLAIAQPTSQAAQSKPEIQPTTKKQELVDWEGKSNAELWASKIKGASEEKIRRSFNAITLYNDTVATGDDDRLAITNQALRELSGVNGLLVGDWIKAHASEVISHNSKYGMQNAKDPSKAETYYNKRHGAEKITSILSLINEQCLDGEALKSQQK